VNGSTEAPDSSLIVPLIKRADAEGMGDPPRWRVPDSDIPILEQLTSYLLVAYVFDLPDWFEYVTPRHCERLKLAVDDLRPLGVRNLTRLRSQPTIRTTPELAMFRMDQSLESSLLLADHLWSQVGPKLAGDLVVAVPSRDPCSVAKARRGVLSPRPYERATYGYGKAARNQNWQPLDRPLGGQGLLLLFSVTG